MVDIVCIADLTLQVHVVIDGSDDVFLRDVLRNQLTHIPVDLILQRILIVASFFQNSFEYRVIY